MIETIIYAVLAAMFYAGIVYVKKSLDTNEPEEFDSFKFLSTVIVGGFVGILLSGSPITEAAIQVQLGIYASVTMFVENGLKILYRYMKMKGWF